MDRQPGDFSATVNAIVPLRTAVQQVLADRPVVYVVNNPGDSITILNCASGACAVTSTVSLGAGAAPVAAVKMDLDGDGRNDIVILNQGTGTIATLLSSSPGAPQVSDIGPDAVAFNKYTPDAHHRLNIGRCAEIYAARLACMCSGASKTYKTSRECVFGLLCENKP